MKPSARVKVFRYLAYILILFSFETQAQVAGMVIFNQPINKTTESIQQSGTVKSPTTKSAKKVTTKAKNSKKKSPKSAKKVTTKAKNSKKKSPKSAKKVRTNKSNTNETKTANDNSNPPSTININPLRDLGIDKGYVCFRVKAYTNNEISDFSRAVCIYVKNSNEFMLTWASPSSNSVIGYHVYYGNSAKKTDNFITDVM